MKTSHLFCLVACGCGRVDFEPVASCADATRVDACSSIPKLVVDPVVDGILDCGLAPGDLTPMGWRGSGSGPPASVSAKYAVAWRPDRMYFFVDITDPDRFSALPEFCADGVELYVDSDGSFEHPPTYDDPGTRQFTIAAPANDGSSLKNGGVYVDRVRRGTWSSTQFGAFSRPGGYVVEAVVTAPDLGLATWAPAVRIGFDLAIDVSTPDGSLGPLISPLCPNGDERLGQFFVRVTTPNGPCDGGPYCDVAASCTPTLLP